MPQYDDYLEMLKTKFKEIDVFYENKTRDEVNKIQNKMTLIKTKKDEEVSIIQNEMKLISTEKEKEVSKIQNEIKIIEAEKEKEIVNIQNEIRLISAEKEKVISEIQNEIKIIEANNDKEVVKIQNETKIIKDEKNKGISSLVNEIESANNSTSQLKISKQDLFNKLTYTKEMIRTSDLKILKINNEILELEYLEEGYRTNIIKLDNVSSKLYSSNNDLQNQLDSYRDILKKKMFVSEVLTSFYIILFISIILIFSFHNYAI